MPFTRLRIPAGTLPAWASFYLSLGRIARERGGQRLTLAVIAPTTVYAAAFSATGAVLAGACEQRAQAGPADPSEWFGYLLSLPDNTPVSVARNNQCQVARLMSDRPHGAIQLAYTRNGPVSIYSACRARDVKMAANIFPLGIAPADFALPINTPRRHSLIDDFTEPLFDGAYYSLFAAQSCNECTVIGPLAELQQQVSEPAFQIGALAGPLQRILHPYLYADDHHRPYRSVLLSDRTAVELPSRQLPPVVIFDGAAAFIRHHIQRAGQDLFADSNWLIVLDRRDQEGIASARAALQVLLESRSELPAETATLLQQTALPPGIELLSFIRPLPYRN